MIYDVNFSHNPELFEQEEYQDNFMYESPDHPTDIIVSTMYFAFTSLSTVGFGDYHPVNDIERVFGAFILLFGVAIFSIIMGNFIEILNFINTFNADIDEGDDLSKFFGTIRHFNNNEGLSKIF